MEQHLLFVPAAHHLAHLAAGGQWKHWAGMGVEGRLSKACILGKGLVYLFGHASPERSEGALLIWCQCTAGLLLNQLLCFAFCEPNVSGEVSSFSCELMT